MLVLSRRPGQKVLIPDFGIAVQVLANKGSAVRLGITAPPEVTVLREEVSRAGARDRIQSAHDFRGRVNTLTMALHLADKQIESGLVSDARETLRSAQELLEEWGEKPPSPRCGHSERMIEALLVEDNPNEEALLSGFLRLNGVHVQTAHDGCEALEFLASHKQPDFVLLDMKLPRCDGPTTVVAIRQNPACKNVAIFAVTGSPPSEFDLPLGKNGVDAWFQKPLNPSRLLEAMNAAAAHN